MSVNTAAIKLTYPLPVYNFRVTILENNIPFVLGFSEVSGLAVSYEPVTYKHGLSFLMGDKVIPGMRQPIRVTMKKGIAVDGVFLQAWFDRYCREPWLSTSKPDIVIDLCDELGLPVMHWKLIQVLPIKLEAPTLTASSNEVAIASMELVANDIKTNFNPV